MVWVVLPLKDFVNAKQRLSGVLAPHERRRLFHAMVEDVLDVLSQHPLIEQTVIVSDDPSAAMLAEHYQVEYLEESRLNAKGLNDVVTAAAKVLAEERGVEDILIVHGDLPLISEHELQRLIMTHQMSEKPAISIAPDTHKQGSNCMLCSPPQVIQFHYGENSFQKHSDEAKQRDITVNVVPQPGLACDIDNPADLDALLVSNSVRKHSFRYLEDSGIADRLRAMAIGGLTIADAIGEAER